MKKIVDFWESSHPILKKLIMELKIAFLIVVTSVTSVFATSTYSQVAKVSLDMENKTLEQVMDEIEMQSEFYFIFNQKQIDVNRVVSVQAKNTLIDDILPELFKGTNVNYAVLDRKILLTTDPIENNLLAITSETGQQQIKVTGVVTDNYGIPLPGVNVVVTGTTQGTITDIAGKYSIEVPPGSKSLTFSFIGMVQQEITIGTLTQINATMDESAIGLDEVVVVGYGTQRKANLTGSVSSVKSDRIEYKLPTNSSMALAGEMSGVSIRQLSGNPMYAKGSIRIRGISNLGEGRDPLVIVDGIPSSIDNIDPNDIKSVSLLKDAASAAIYGSRAGDGVILIETKTGQEGVTKFNFYSYVGLQHVTMMPEMAPSWIYAEAMNEALINQGGYARFTEAEIEKYKLGTDPEFPNYDHMAQVFESGTGLQNKQGLSMSGGTKVMKYMFSASYLNNQGVIRRNKAQEYNVRLNLDSKLRENLKLTVNLSGNQRAGIQPGSGGGATGGGIASATRAALRLNNTIIGKRDDGYFGHLETVHYGNLWSPSFYESKGLAVVGASSLEWKVFKDFTLTGRLGYTQGNDEFQSFQAKWDVSPILSMSPSQLTQGWSKDNKLTAQALTNYNKSFGKHAINILGGFEQSESNYSTLEAFRDNLPTNDLTQINVGSVTNAQNSGDARTIKTRSYFGRVNYGYQEKYLFEANLRYDGSSRFPKESRWGLFPSFSAGWRISQEEFLQNLAPWIYNLKLRGSWGQLGNEVASAYPYQNVIDLDISAGFGNSLAPAAAITTIANRNITWETVTMSNIGLDLDVFEGKLGLVVNWYKRITADILYNLTASNVIGTNTSPVNAGKVENKGWEFELFYKNTHGDFSYSLSGNLSINHNKVVSLAGVEQDIERGLFVGFPVGSSYGYVADGLFVDLADVEQSPVQTALEAAPGLIKFKDLNGPEGVPDGIVNAGYDRTIIGQPLPITMYGFNINANYKGAYVSLLLQGEGGRLSSIWRQRHFMAFCNDGNIQQWQYDGRWTEDNPDPNAEYPKLRIGGVNLVNNQMSSFWFRNSSFIRLKDIQVGYNISSKLLTRFNINNLRLYLNGENIFIIQNFFPGWDPEMLSENIWGGFHPPYRTLTFGINIDF